MTTGSGSRGGDAAAARGANRQGAHGGDARPVPSAPLAPAPAASAATTATTAGVSADRIALLQTFVRIVEAGSLSAAAAQSGATQPTVSRRLQALEQSLGVRLLQRSTHAMTLTEDGRRCFERAKDLLASWHAFEADLRGSGDEPEGLLRVVAPHAFGQQQLVEPLAAFLRRHPAVDVEWLLHDDVQNYIADGVDCGIQVGEVADPSVVAIRLSEVRRIVVAAPSLAAGFEPDAAQRRTRRSGRRRGAAGDRGADAADEQIDALSRLPWLALRTYYRREVSLTHAASGETRQFAIRPRLSTDSLYALRSAALLGLGACVVSAWVVADDLAQGRLVHLAPQWRAAPLPVYVVYPHARFYPARLRRFVEVMREAMRTALGEVGAPRT